MTSREVTLRWGPPLSDADCSVYNSSEGSFRSLGGAAARSKTVLHSALNDGKSRGGRDSVQWLTSEIRRASLGFTAAEEEGGE